MEEVFPLFYTPRPYQTELHQMWNTKRIGVAVLPRQCGKDTAMSMESVGARLKNEKTTGVYVAPTSPAVRNILWDKSYWDPEAKKMVKMLQDNVPRHWVKWKDHSMVGVFKNQSRLKLEGYFQSGNDENGVGTSFDDYSFTELSLFQREDPIPRLQPIIDSDQPNKRLMAVATPRGRRQNPLWKLMEIADTRSDAQVILRTIDDLNAIMKRYGLPPVKTQESLEKTAATYLMRFGNARMFEQEFYCSFEEIDAAAVYGEVLSRLQKEKRDEPFNWAREHPMYVAFDIGSSGKHSDATAWIAFQWVNEKLYLIDCGEGHGIALPEYVDVLQSKPWYSQLAQIILPWDGDHHEVAIRETPADMMRKRFPSVAVLAKGTNIWKTSGLPNTDSADIITMVQSVRLQLYKTYINGLSEKEKGQATTRPNCDRIIDCMENYKYAYNNKMQQWSEYPVHDKYSHMMDALRYVVQATKELEFFNGSLYTTGQQRKSLDYIEDYSGVW